ncbi:hypothetical protein RvY_06218 [Ramazzottius varieornatus]|uniref:SUEL-type lectin domain-containing protein n=1 Tax=Ramazzottius varieornatus TaxID=947166 RepID=A0A1D1UXS5_RAMVA|nr:hypothetical protein RvY_06218 [Ramazzottius varieornatus]
MKPQSYASPSLLLSLILLVVARGAADDGSNIKVTIANVHSQTTLRCSQAGKVLAIAGVHHDEAVTSAPSPTHGPLAASCLDPFELQVMLRSRCMNQATCTFKADEAASKAQQPLIVEYQCVAPGTVLDSERPANAMVIEML